MNIPVDQFSIIYHRSAAYCSLYELNRYQGMCMSLVHCKHSYDRLATRPETARNRCNTAREDGSVGRLSLMCMYCTSPRKRKCLEEYPTQCHFLHPRNRHAPPCDWTRRSVVRTRRCVAVWTSASPQHPRWMLAYLKIGYDRLLHDCLKFIIYVIYFDGT
jgi:hypothetical protein